MDRIKFHWSMMMDLLGLRRSRRTAFSIAVGTVLFYVLRRVYYQYKVTSKLHKKKNEIERRMHAFRLELKAKSLNTDELLKLTELNLQELRKRIDSGALDPVNLLHAYQLKALTIFEGGNSGICEFISEAEHMFKEFVQQEQSSDSSYDIEERIRKRSPLYGIPISIKESMQVERYDSTCGIIKRCNEPVETSSVFIQVLRKVGAIPFVLTSTSQACRTIEGVNFIFGDAVNPFNRDRISGGSSSGEGVLLGQRGSPLGVGSDIGGSIRIPAAFCGLASLKPTVLRLSAKGMANLCSRSVLFLSDCPGPMGHRVDDCADMMRALLNPVMFELDPLIPPMLFNEDIYQGRNKASLTIGMYTTIDDPYIMSTVPVVREAVRVSADLLARSGHKVVRFQVPNPWRAMCLFMRALMIDGGSQLNDLLYCEPIGSHLKPIKAIFSIPYFLKSLIDFSAPFVGLSPLALTGTMGGFRHAREVTQLRNDIQDYKREFVQAWKKAGPIDALICPVSAFPAPPCKTPSLFVTPSIMYTTLYNLVDYPAGTVPVALVDRVDVMQATKMAVDRRLDGDWYASKVAMMQKDSEGLPVAVQVVGQPYQEELVLRVMQVIEFACNRHTSVIKTEEV